MKKNIKDLICFLRIHLWETLYYESEYTHKLLIIKEFRKCRNCGKEKIKRYENKRD